MNWKDKLRPTAFGMGGLSVVTLVAGTYVGADPTAVVAVSSALAGAAVALCTDGAPPTVPASSHDKLIDKVTDSDEG